MRNYISMNAMACLAAFVLASVVGFTLDRRIKDQLAQDRAMVKPELFSVPSKEQEIYQRIERESGLKGRPLLSLTEWTPVEPVLMDGLDVSNLFAGEFVYAKSLSRDFRVSRIVLDAQLSRPGAFFDVGVPLAPESALVFRFSQEGVGAFTRAKDGVMTRRSEQANPIPLGCARFELVRGDEKWSVVCQGITALQINSPQQRQGRVFVASNLTGGELRELSVTE